MPLGVFAQSKKIQNSLETYVSDVTKEHRRKAGLDGGRRPGASAPRGGSACVNRCRAQFAVSHGDGVPCRSPGTVRCPGTSARVASRIPKALRGRWHSPRCKMRGEKTGQVIKGTRPRPRVLADGQKQSSDPSLGPRRLGSLPRTHRAVFFASARRRQCKLHV